MNYCVTKLVFTRMFVLKIKSFYGLKPEINDNKTKINDRHDIKSDDIVKKKFVVCKVACRKCGQVKAA